MAEIDRIWKPKTKMKELKKFGIAINSIMDLV